MLKKKWLLIICMLIFSLSMAGCATAQAEDGGGTYSSTGIVECKEVDVRAKIPGKITEICVGEGQEVQAGDVLFSTDERDLAIKRSQAQAAVNAAKAQLSKAQNGATRETVESAKALTDKAQVNVDLLQKEYDKMLIMQQTGGVAEDTMDKLATQLEATKLDAYAARQQYQTALNGAREEDIQALQAQYEGATAILDEVNLNLDATNVVAPLSGIITMISSEVGELIATGTPVATITDYANRWVLVNVDELHIGQLRVGDQAAVTAKAYPGKKFIGTILTISRTPDFATKKSTNELNDQDIVTYEVKISIPADDDLLYPGMLTTVIFGNKK